MTKYTSRPWTFRVDDDGEIFVDHGHPGHKSTCQECVANAHLMVAAPDMYEALEWFIKYAEKTWEPMADNEPRFVERCRKAIKKAQGEE